MQQQLVLNNAVIASACGCAADRDDESEEPPPEDQDFEEKLDVPRKNIIFLAVLFTGVPPCSGHAAADAHGAQQPSLACGTLLYDLDILDMYWLTGHVSSSSTSALKWRICLIYCAMLSTPTCSCPGQRSGEDTRAVCFLSLLAHSRLRYPGRNLHRYHYWAEVGGSPSGTLRHPQASLPTVCRSAI